MEMKKPLHSLAGIVLSILLSFFLLPACGGKSAPPKPAHLLAGSRQIQEGYARYDKGCYHRALEHFMRAHELFSATDQVDNAAMSLNNIGTVYRVLGNPEKAMSFFYEAAELYRDVNDLDGARQALSNVAAALVDIGRLDDAMSVLDSAQSLTPEEEEKPFLPIANNRAVILTKKGQLTEAQALLDAAFKSLKDDEGANTANLANLHFAYGKLLLAQNKAAQAVFHFEKALTADRQRGYYAGMADDLSALGDAHLAAKSPKRAVKAYKRAVLIYAQIDLPAKLGTTMETLEQEAKRTGEDLTITKMYVKRWSEGKLYENPCGK